ncbi:hypothetical protein PACTADRAFT_49806 [Pachysolen tannophilus NRRL Y-2460]|uniref:25S rRNA (Uridine(2843)-N(3))-methyltransferase n=1 Tax=Pachysolen tannophilus NRRL Y-2460 TaxID=669874 RepID=A0A1E4TXH3_PACTA|nr:hypothetical protein PACTADRAFT_49806 [Pachysolen tannophilus NRRL Y-2460]
MSSRRIARRHAKLEREKQDGGGVVDEDGTEKSNTNLIPTSSNYQYDVDDILRLFKTCFDQVLSDQPLLQEKIQAVKSDLFNRDYITAFDDESKRCAYVARWSPARSLSYSSLFAHLQKIRNILSDFNNELENDDINVVCIGGGAGAELVGISSVFCRSRESFSSSKRKIKIRLIDIADWSDIVFKISSYINTNWLYNGDGVFNTDFIKTDVLELTNLSEFFTPAKLITLLFTTNELFQENKKKALLFLQKLNQFCSKGCLLLITESAGSYSHIEIGSKKFPLQYLIDTILCGKPGEIGNWEIIDENDSTWYRLDKNYNYDLRLENMRFFYRLYRKL